MTDKELIDKEYDEFMTKCANIPYKDYSWLKDHCHRTLKRPCSPNVRNEHLAILDLIKEHEERQWIPVTEGLPEDRREVLVTAYWHETYQVMMASYYGDGLWWCVPFNNCGEHMQRLNPKAWIPIPEPYKQEVENGRTKNEFYKDGIWF